MSGNLVGPFAGYNRQMYGQAPPTMILHRPAGALPQTTQTEIFRIRGGQILLKQLVGKLTVASDGTASNLNPVANPDSGVTDVNLATATAIASLGVGTLLNPASAGIGAALQKAGATSGLSQDLALDIGTIDLLTSGSNAGARAEWFLHYQPLSPGANVVPGPSGVARGLVASVSMGKRWTKRLRATVPATAQAAIFRVTGGPILLWALVGKVTTAFDATATNLTVVANPTSGLTDVNLCTATAVASTAAATLLSLQAAGIGSALVKAGATNTLLIPIIVDTGTIDLLTSDTNAGAVEWNALWEPLHPGGRLIVA